MRAQCDKAAAFFSAVQIILQIESEHGLHIPDTVVEQIKPWEELTIRDLVEATNRCLAADCRPLHQTEAMVASAIKSAFPDAPDMLDFDAPIMDAIEPDRDYGDSGRASPVR
ncbi:MAG: hypothetical protein KDB14_30290 [Planctomycetales bacterium]|nr:hypothetical protein [Planctomycetales bacterium]